MAQIIPIRPQAALHAAAPQSPGCGAATGQLAKLEAGLAKVAKLIAAGEEWALPLFLHLESEIATLNARQTHLDRARGLAQMNSENTSLLQRTTASSPKQRTQK